jgi:NitT/TauT family transport system permease protein
LNPRSVLAFAAMLVSVPLLWLAALRFSHLPPAILPPPGRVLTVFREDGMVLAYHTWVTLYEALLGYAIANVLAFSLAVSYYYAPRAESFVTPWTIVIKNVPFVSVASLLVITFGDTLTPKLIVVVLVTFFPLLANLVKGFKSADPVLVDRLRVLHATRWQIFSRVLLPSALPYYVAAHEIAFTSSIIAAIISEWSFSRRGLGYLIIEAVANYRVDRLYAINIVGAALALTAYFACKLWESWLFRWKADLQSS